jgi:hypothetical protein
MPNWHCSNFSIVLALFLFSVSFRVGFLFFLFADMLDLKFLNLVIGSSFSSFQVDLNQNKYGEVLSIYEDTVG